MPGEVQAGRYELALGVLENASSRPIVRLAIAGRDADGWYPLGRIGLQAAAMGAVR